MQGLITWLALDLGEVSGGDIGHGEGYAFLLAVIHLNHGSGHHNDPLWA